MADDRPKAYWDPASRSPREWFTVAAIALALAGVFLILRLIGSGGAWILPVILVAIGLVNLVQGLRAGRRGTDDERR